MQAWVRKRCAQGGLPRPSAVHVLSSTKRWGVRELLADLQRAAGSRGDVWVVGAQNAGKSSLINAMRGVAGLGEERNVTAAPLPGTTLGEWGQGCGAVECEVFGVLRVVGSVSRGSEPT